MINHVFNSIIHTISWYDIHYCKIFTIFEQQNELKTDKQDKKHKKNSITYIYKIS